MYKTVVVLVTLLATAAYCLPAISDVAELRDIQRLQLENTFRSDNDPQELKNRLEFNEIADNYQDSEGNDYLQPDWAAQGSVESEEEPDRIVRSASYGDSSDSDDDFSISNAPDCEDLNSSEESSEEYVTKVVNKNPEETTTIVAETRTGNPDEILAIDRRFGVPEARKKRMAWNVMRSSNEFDEGNNPPKIRWMWDDQKPEVPLAEDDFVEGVYLEKSDGFSPQVPEVNVLKPCASKFHRRDRHGRCRLTLV